MATDDSSWRPGARGVAQPAVVHRPRNLTVVASAAIGTRRDFVHRRTGRADTHLESQLAMANPTLKANPMKPVREDDWPHLLLPGTVIQHHVAVLGDASWREAAEAGNQGAAPWPSRHNVQFHGTE